MTFFRFLLPLFLSLATPLILQASLVIESVDQHEQQPEKVSRLYLDALGLRGESSDGIFIYRPDKKLLWMLEPDKKTYRQLSETELSSMTSKMTEAMKQLNEQLAQLPPEQRAVVEQMMKTQMPAGVPTENLASPPASKQVETTYTKTASGEKVGTWTCDQYVEKEDGEKTAEIWTVSPSSFANLTPYRKMMENLASFFSQLPTAGGKPMDMPLFRSSPDAPDAGPPGIPVKEIRYHADGRVSFRWEMRSIKEEAADPTLFEIPPGYERRTFNEAAP